MTYPDPPSPAKYLCTLHAAKRARPGLSLPLSVLLLSGRLTINYSVHSHTCTITLSSQHPHSFSFHQFEVFVGHSAIVLSSTFRKGGGPLSSSIHYNFVGFGYIESTTVAVSKKDFRHGDRKSLSRVKAYSALLKMHLHL